MLDLRKELTKLLFLFFTISHSAWVLAFDGLDSNFWQDWQDLLHAELLDREYKSRVVTKGFLLSSESTTFDAEQELTATLNSFTSQEGVCAKPSRYFFLSRYFDLPESRLFDCKYLEDVSYESLVGSDISVVYASGYLGNPASYYGHMLLRISQNSSKNRLLDTAVNFGAINAMGDDPISYIAKGLFGGYEGAFSAAPFFIFDNQYRAVEQRDLWEYDLQLDAEAKKLLLLHIHEMQQFRFEYYFMGRNCVSAFADLLNVVTKVDFDASKRHLVYPHSWLKFLERTNEIKVNINFLPSQTTSFRQRFEVLNDNQKELLHSYAKENSVQKRNTHSNLDKAVALDTLILYSKGFLNKDESEQRALARIAKLRLELDETSTPFPRADDFNVRPDQGRPPARVTWNYSQSTEDSFQLLQIRPAFYDEFDGRSLGFHGSALIMAQGVLSFNQEDKVSLESLTLLEINNGVTNATNFGVDNDYGWHGKFGYERRKSPLCKSMCSGIFSELGITKAILNSSNVNLSASTELSISGASKNRSRGSVSIIGFAEISPSIEVGIHARRYDTSTDYNSASTVHLKLSRKLDPRNVVELSVTKARETVTTLGWHRYF